MKKTFVACVAVLAMTQATANAADSENDQFVSKTIRSLSALDHEACKKNLTSEKQDAHIIVSALAFRTTTVNLALEGKRLVCEASRLETEANRLQSEQMRLLEEAERLDRAWKKASTIAPSKFGDYTGRDQSQKRLRRDADIIGGTVLRLKYASSDLRDEAERLLKLSLAEYAELSEEHQGLLVASLDAETQFELLERLLGLKKPVQVG